jgi:arsenate reductase
MDYRSLGMKDILPTLSESEALKLLSENGNLVKRPLVFTEKGVINGFKEADWADYFSNATS